MCFKHIENDLKLCLKTHQVVFKRLNSQFMVACIQSWLKKNKTQQEKTSKPTKILNKSTESPNPTLPPPKNQPTNHKPTRYVICFTLVYNILKGKHFLHDRKEFSFTHIFLCYWLFPYAFLYWLVFHWTLH